MSEHLVKPGDVIRMDPAPTVAACPFEMRDWLHARGWSNQFGDRWYMYTKHRESFTWEQAMACEFYEFITLGGAQRAENQKG